MMSQKSNFRILEFLNLDLRTLKEHHEKPLNVQTIIRIFLLAADGIHFGNCHKC